MAALFIPVFVIATGLALPFWVVGDDQAVHQHVHRIVSFWVVRLVLFAVIFFSLFHCAHRFRHILMDLGLRTASRTLAVCCYGGALLGAGVAAFLLIVL